MFIQSLIIISIIAFIEFYFYKVIGVLIKSYSQRTKKIIKSIVLFFAFSSLIVSVVSSFYPPENWWLALKLYAMSLLLLLICKLIGCLFLIIEDIIRLLRLINKLIFRFFKPQQHKENLGISRLKFFSQLALTFTFIPLVSLLYGIFKGAYNYKLHFVSISSKKIPSNFNGFKIAQISDIHCGSFINTEPLETAFKLLLDQKPDMILFTGDLVNLDSSETDTHLDTFKMLKAPYGVYSCLGNHDYGDYRKWPSKAAKTKNLLKLKEVHKNSGWHLLMNEHVMIEKNEEQIALIGIENWGASFRFPKYGNLPKALKNLPNEAFQILMSHDPSHWEKQVSNLKQFKNIDLTLSGHTHGMQFGIEIPGFKWSPSKYLYKYWAGLYKKNNQFLYVNRGLGFLGYPGRLGIWPEITIIELKKVG